MTFVGADCQGSPNYRELDGLGPLLRRFQVRSVSGCFLEGSAIRFSFAVNSSFLLDRLMHWIAVRVVPSRYQGVLQAGIGSVDWVDVTIRHQTYFAGLDAEVGWFFEKRWTRPNSDAKWLQEAGPSGRAHRD